MASADSLKLHTSLDPSAVIMANFRFRGERATLLLVLCAVIPGASSAQQNSESSQADHRTIRKSSEAIGPWLLNPDEGLAIIGAALESRHTDSSADCSNLVHTIYERAGFSYSYANSSELYGGIKAFRQVIHPQPGDLVVWRGHVGIVISPVQHSFFSAMRSGRGLEFYDSPYWAARGRPRFFRYLRATRPTLLSASTRDANLRPNSSGNAESHDQAPGDEDSDPALAVFSPRTASRTSMLGPNLVEPNPELSDGRLSRQRVSVMTPPAALSGVDGTQGASLHHSERQTAHDAQSPMARDTLTRADRQTENQAAGAGNTATARTSRSLPGSAATPAPRYVPRPPPGFWASSTAAKHRGRSRRNLPRM